jgi:hypothetical protein
MATKRNRTKSGGVSATARKKSGGGKGLRKGSFPVFDTKSARSAIKLRGHAKSKSAVLTKVNRWASKTGNASVKKAVAAARKRDRKK